MSRLFEAHFLWWDVLLRFDVGDRGLVLLHLDVPGLVDFRLGDHTLSIERDALDRVGVEWKERR